MGRFRDFLFNGPFKQTDEPGKENLGIVRWGAPLIPNPVARVLLEEGGEVVEGILQGKKVQEQILEQTKEQAQEMKQAGANAAYAFVKTLLEDSNTPIINDATHPILGDAALLRRAELFMEDWFQVEIPSPDDDATE